jgi:hypothetical protein
MGLFGLLLWTSAGAQRADTIRVGQDADTADIVAPQDTVQTVEAVQPTVDTSRSRDASDDHTEPVVLRTVADSAVTNWKGDRAYEYANDPEYWRWRDYETKYSERQSTRHSLLASRGFEYFILILMGGVLVYAIVRIIVANRLQVFYRAPRRPMAVKSEEGGSLEDDLDGQLMHFMQTKNYRQAVRYLYLKTLRLLNERGLIRYRQEATNQEYWQQLRATPQGSSFRNLTMIYEQVWYGEFPLEDGLFGRLHQYFEEFYKSVRA